jgi:hypothetical protein
MSKNNQHYVPQFYLRNFGINSKLIHLFYLQNKRIISEAGIKHQCYKRKFYGSDEVIENNLAQKEQLYSQIIRQVFTKGMLPAKNTPEYDGLLEFVAIQWLRTKSFVDGQIENFNLMVNEMIKEYPDEKELLIQYLGNDDDVIKISIGLVDIIVKSINDLEMHLVYSGYPNCFFTSDNPVNLYNIYFQSINYIGGVGTAGKGTLFFVPLSAHYLIILYDSKIYKIIGNELLTQYPTPKDVADINKLQIIFADESLYFDNNVDIENIQTLVKKTTKLRNKNRRVVKVLDEIGSAVNSSLIVSKIITPNLNLDLSFIKIKKNAKKISLKNRALDRYRKEMPELNKVPTLQRPAVFRSRDKKETLIFHP